MTAAPVFAQRTILWLIAVGGLSFVCTIALIVFGRTSAYPIRPSRLPGS
jgi:hypothetical protein